MAKRKDICPVTKNGPFDPEYWQCSLPRNHIKLLLVKEGDRRQRFLEMASKHNFKPRLPHRTKE